MTTITHTMTPHHMNRWEDHENPQTEFYSTDLLTRVVMNIYPGGNGSWVIDLTHETFTADPDLINDYELNGFRQVDWTCTWCPCCETDPILEGDYEDHTYPAETPMPVLQSLAFQHALTMMENLR